MKKIIFFLLVGLGLSAPVWGETRLDLPPAPFINHEMKYHVACPDGYKGVAIHKDNGIDRLVFWPHYMRFEEGDAENWEAIQRKEMIVLTVSPRKEGDSLINILRTERERLQAQKIEHELLEVDMKRGVFYLFDVKSAPAHVKAFIQGKHNFYEIKAGKSNKDFVAVIQSLGEADSSSNP